MPFSSPPSKLFLILQDLIWYHLLQKVSWELSHPCRADVLLDSVISQKFLSHSDSIFTCRCPSLKHKVLQAETAFIYNFFSLVLSTVSISSCYSKGKTHWTKLIHSFIIHLFNKYLVSMEINSRHYARLNYTTVKSQITNLCLYNMLYGKKYYGKRKIHWAFWYLKW